MPVVRWHPRTRDRAGCPPASGVRGTRPQGGQMLAHAHSLRASLAAAAVAALLATPAARAAGSPEGTGDIAWDLAAARHEAKGCDLWQTTWAPDGSLRTGWGDCLGPRPAPRAKL